MPHCEVKAAQGPFRPWSTGLSTFTSAAKRPSADALRSGARRGRVALAVGIDIERTRPALDHLAANDHLFHAFQARQVEHGVEQDAFHDRTQAAGAGLAIDCLARDRAHGFLVYG